MRDIRDSDIRFLDSLVNEETKQDERYKEIRRTLKKLLGGFPIAYREDYGWTYSCPHCEEYLDISDEPNYCPHCGQRLVYEMPEEN